MQFICTVVEQVITRGAVSSPPRSSILGGQVSEQNAGHPCPLAMRLLSIIHVLPTHFSLILYPLVSSLWTVNKLNQLEELPGHAHWSIPKGVLSNYCRINLLLKYRHACVECVSPRMILIPWIGRHFYEKYIWVKRSNAYVESCSSRVS